MATRLSRKLFPVVSSRFFSDFSCCQDVLHFEGVVFSCVWEGSDRYLEGVRGGVDWLTRWEIQGFEGTCLTGSQRGEYLEVWPWYAEAGGAGRGSRWLLVWVMVVCLWKKWSISPMFSNFWSQSSYKSFIILLMAVGSIVMTSH